MKQPVDEKAKLRIENKKLQDEIKKLKITVLQLQTALKMQQRKMATIKHTLAFTENEYTRFKIKNLGS